MNTHFKFTPRCFQYVIVAAFSFIICNISYAQLKVNYDGSTEFFNSIKGNQSGAVRISTGYGYVDVGAKNANYCNFITDRNKFSFNKGISFTGELYSSGNFYLYQTGLSCAPIQVISSTSRVGIMLACTPPQYTLDVAGIIRATNVTPSDQNLKKDIKDLPTTRIDGLYNLKAKTYKYKSFGNYTTNEPTINKSKKSTDDDKEFIGLIAQDIREVYPELVFEDSLGILSLNYDGLIPVIIEALKEQKKEIEELQTTILQITSKNKNAEEITFVTDNNAQLIQNKPNPFNDNTSIDFYLPTTVAKAILCIYDLQGKQVKSISIAARGNGSVTINGNELQAGMYYYSLIADGNVIGTMNMILTE